MNELLTRNPDAGLLVVIGIVVGIIAFILTVAIIIPNDPARRMMTWLAERDNVPTMLMPLGILSIIVFVSMIGVALWIAFGKVNVPPLVWLAGAFGIVWLLIWQRTRVIRLFRRRAAAAPAAPPPAAAP